MKKPTITPDFYLSLLEFLLSCKQQVVSVGNEFGLTNVQVLTLLLINESQPRPMKRLGVLFHCDASNVTGIIDGLELKKLVSRRSDPTDRRIKIVCLEPAGKKMQQDIIGRLTEGGDSLFAALNQNELEHFVQAMDKLATSKSYTV